MRVEAVTAPSAPATPAPQAPALTRRASLNAVQALLDYGGKLLVGFVVTPLLVTGLGASLYGVWEILSRLIGYITAADARPTEALRLVIATRQGLNDPAGDRRAVGSALVVWLIFLPLVIAVGAALVWLAPLITKVDGAARPAVQLATALLVATFLLGALAAVPESVLRGMNLGYKRMGLQAGLSLAGGALMVLAVRRGLGIPGLALSQLILGGLTGACFWLLARRYVSWFGVASPSRPEVRALLGISGWLAGGELIAKVSLASDVLILGAVVSSSVVTTYVLTGYASRLALGLHFLVVGSAMPGLGGVLPDRPAAERCVPARRRLAAARARHHQRDRRCAGPRHRPRADARTRDGRRLPRVARRAGGPEHRLSRAGRQIAAFGSAPTLAVTRAPDRGERARARRRRVGQ
ncbi:MAG: hypothetical protein DMD59_05260 [Gemmatimonadetes bacterium]|nr:MAG: hypothetical protein DMD59_05260 [Gemmatimonadota bacterium]